MATNTTATATNHTGNGSTNSFAISFSFLANNEVDVTVAGVLKTLDTHYTISGSTVTFTSGNTPANGAAIKFQRNTNISTKKVDFTDGSVLTETDLDTNSDQVLFAQQEITDKLGGIEENATADQTAAEIRTLVGDATDSNVFTDAEKTKLTGIDTNAKDDQTASEIKTLIASSPLDASHLAANSVNTSELADDSVTYSKLQNVSATDRVLGRDSSGAGVVEEITPANLRTMINVEDGATADQTNAEIKTAYEANSNTNAFTDAEKTKLTSVETNAKDDQTASEIKTLYESNSNTNALTDAEKTVIDGVTANTSEINKLDGFTGSTSDLNQVSGMSKQTTITNSDNHFPTSGAVVDFVANQIAPVGGLEVIADEDSFPATQPVSGVVISISNADGLVINSSGVATNARTVGSGSDNVTINNFPTSLRSKTLSNELGLLVSSTGASQIYNYHKLLAKETDVLQLSEDINDFNNRYRVVDTNPTSDNDAGDLIFNRGTQKLLVYNATSGAYEEAQSVGNFFISTLSPAFDGSTQDFTITNAPSNAQQIILSINGVIQKPNAGSSTPSEGFALSGSTVKLAAAPASGSDYFAIVLGSTVNIGTPSNNTVTSAMIVDGSIVNADISNSADIAGSKLSLVSTSSTAGIIVKGDGSSDGYLQLNCSQNSHGIKLKSPPHSAGQSYTLTFPSNIVNGQFLTTDANGNLSWAAVVTDLVNDTSPQLGGNLDTNNHDVTFQGLNNLDVVWDYSEADLTFSDSAKLRIGSGNDLSIYHSSGNTFLQNATGYMYLQSDSISLAGESVGQNYIVANLNGAVTVGYAGNTKLETTSSGITVTGSLTATNHVFIGHHDYLYFTSTAGYNPRIGNADGGTGVNMTFHTNNTMRMMLQNDGHLRPASNNSYDLGTSSDRWRNIYTSDLNMSNEGSCNDVDGTWGSYTIQEGEEDLFLINKRNGKKYKFNLTEVK